jgi:glycosyltransferase involved in cell wall biosynthesis
MLAGMSAGVPVIAPGAKGPAQSPAESATGVVVFRRTGAVDDIDAIDEYSRRLVDALLARGIDVRYEAGGLAPVLGATSSPDWVLLQYNPFRYGRGGLALGLMRDALRLRRRNIALAIMVHEAWVPMDAPRRTLIGLWQRLQLRFLLRLAGAVMTSTEALARELGRGALHMPVATNVSPVATSPQAARDRLRLDGKLTVALFGRANDSRAYDYVDAAIAALSQTYGADHLVVLNLGADAPLPHVPPGVELRSPGRQTADELSRGLWASHMVLLPLTDGVSTRRGTLMAALAHGRPVLGLTGHNTDTVLTDAHDALALSPMGESAAFAQAAVDLAGDACRLQNLGDAGRRLYEARFDWPVLARDVDTMLRSLGRRQPAPAFVTKP